MAGKKRKTGDIKGLTQEEAEVYKQAGADIDKSDIKGTPEYAEKQLNKKYESLNTGMTPTDPLLENANDKPLGDFIKTGGQNPDVITDIENHDTAMDANKQAFEEVQSGKSTMGTEPIETPKMKEREEEKKEQLEEMAQTPDTEIKENVQEAAQVVPESDKGKYNASTQSIWGAWQNGMFGDPDSPEAKNARNYLILDAIAAFASNAGRNLRNVGAQFSGGSIDNGHDSSMWEQRQQEMAAEERAMEREQLGGPAQRRRINEELTNDMNELAKNKASTVNDLINLYKSKVDNPNTNELMRQIYINAITGLSNANISATPLNQAMGTVNSIIGNLLGLGNVGSSFLGR